MDSNEEYLDQLLKSLTENNSSGATGGSEEPEQDDGLGDLLNQFSDDMDNVPGDLLSGLLGGSESAQEELPETEPAALSDVLQDMAEDVSTEMLSEEIVAQQSVLEEPEQAVLEVPEQSAEDAEEDDLGSMLESLGADGDEDAQEISDLLNRADRDEPVDDMVDSLMQGLGEGNFGEDLQGDGETEERPGRKKKKKEKKPRGSKKKQQLQDIAAELPEDNSESLQQGTGENSAEGEKKQGFWGKLLNALIQEEEEEDDPADLVSDENNEILKELDKEKKQAKGKKKKKGKDKKAAETDEDEDLEEASEAKQKKKKEKKPKKEKPPVPAEELLPGKKLPLKKVLPLVAVFLVFCLAYVMVSHLYINHVNKQRAEKAYYAGDYLECYSLLFGQELNESQELMYHRSELALQMERMKGNYRRLVMEGKELEALDYLVQCICRREDTYLQGQEWNSLDVVEEAYAGMTELLTANYGLTEERAVEIAALKSDVDYTLALLQVLEGIGSGSSDQEPDRQDQPASYEDLLPEEEEDSDAAFIDTLR